MAWSVVQASAVQKQGTNASNQTSGAPASSTTAGNSLFIVGYGYTLTGASVVGSDSAGNTYTLVVSTLAAASAFILATHNSTSVSNSGGWFKVDITGAGSTAYWGFNVIEAATGAGIGSTDVTAAGASGTLATPSSGTTASSAGGQELAITSEWFQYPANNATTNSPWTRSSAGAVIVSNFFGITDYQILSPASGTYTATPETVGGAPAASVCVLAIFQAAPGGLPPGATIVRQAVKRASSW